MAQTLSKSDYMLFLRHPAWLWLKKHDKDMLPPTDAATQARFDAGHEFEALAEQLFVEATKLSWNGYNQYEELLPRTQEALSGGATTILQGRWKAGDITCICDAVTVISDGVVDLYEIKSSSSVKSEHELDLAFQVEVLEGCGLKVRDTYVMHVNSSYIRHGDINIDELVTTELITDKVKPKSATTKLHIKRALEVVHSDEMPNPSPAFARLGCMSEWLPIFKSLEHIGPGSIYDLCRLSAQNVAELESMHIEKLTDIPSDFSLLKKQREQVQAAKTDSVTIQKDKIVGFLDSFSYPLYFLDYETLSSTVPYYDGTSPFQQIPFQYSLHVLDSPTAELRQLEYLHRDKSNPVTPLSQKLQNDIGATGSVITWNAKFEMGCNTTMGNMDPQFKQFYEQLNQRIVDLMDPFINSWYVHKEFAGSASIKNVLPVLVPHLSYKELNIQEGGSAQRLWMEAVLDDNHPDQKDKILSDLITYCALDTLAMVEIYKVLRKL